MNVCYQVRVWRACIPFGKIVEHIEAESTPKDAESQISRQKS